MGSFTSPNPKICIAISGHSHNELIKTTLHEYAHFLQYKDGLLDKFGDEPWNVWDKWLQGEDFTQKQLKKSRNTICKIEYDADLRVIELAKQLNINIGKKEDYIKEAYSYVCTIKWSFLNREWDGYYLDGSLFNVGYLTPRQIVRPLSADEIKIIKNGTRQ